MPSFFHSAAHKPLVTPGSLTLARTSVVAPHDPLGIWHLLSLDAPTVAALWVVFVAQAAHVALPWTAAAAMFLAVWVLYAVDRLLDSRASHKASQTNTLEARHHFHAAHREAFLAGIVLVTPALLLLIRGIPPAALRLYLLLGAVLLAWLLLIHLPPAGSHLPKELAVGVFFPAAIFIPTVARAPWFRPVLFSEALLFAGVCSLNCLYIHAWEHSASSSYEAHWTTRWAVRHLRALTLATILLACLVAAGALFGSPVEHWHLALLPALTCAFSATLFLKLHGSRARFSSLHLRAAADLCLLTPLAFLPVLR